MLYSNKINFLFNKIFNILWLTRITLILPILFAGFCSAKLCSGKVFDSHLLIIILSVICLAGGGFALNDIFDTDKDLVDKPKRPIPSGNIKRCEAYFVSFFLIALALLFSLLSGNYLTITEMIIGVFLVFIYSPVSKKIGWLGNLITAFLAVFPWLLPAAYLDSSNAVLPPVIATFVLVFSREILLDIQDIRGDRLLGFKTLPILIGQKVAAWISVSLMLAVSFILFIWSYLNDFAFIAKFVALLGVLLPSLIISIIILTKKRDGLVKMAGHLGKVQFVCGIMMWWLK
jgi:geranylgeranylglycerol-phosphate geranylgeranyltransferase